MSLLGQVVIDRGYRVKWIGIVLMQGKFLWDRFQCNFFCPLAYNFTIGIKHTVYSCDGNIFPAVNDIGYFNRLKFLL